MPTITSIIHIVFQDGSTAWYLNIQGTSIKTEAFTANSILKQFDNESKVEEYNPEQSDTIRKYTTFTFKN